MKWVAELRALPTRTMAGIAVGHAVLLAGVLWGGVPYVLMQALLAFELAAVNAANILIYPERGWLKHFLDTLKLSGALLFVLFFLVVTYGWPATRAPATRWQRGSGDCANSLRKLRAGCSPTSSSTPESRCGRRFDRRIPDACGRSRVCPAAQ